MSAGCCPVCKPPWIRLIDSIYPKNNQTGLQKNNMSKLTFYAMRNPQKLDRIGEYLSKQLKRDLMRNRILAVGIAMEAMDTLLAACHSQSLNLFVESFLKMVQRLLECSDPDLQRLATSSFVKFANIEEDTPSYHRRYDYFVSQFSAMCHSNHQTAKNWIRMAGLQGLQGLIRKTVGDELQPDIWQQHHMDKIVPSLLYNLHAQDDNQTDLVTEAEIPDPAKMAEEVFRDLIRKAAFNNLKSVLRPVLVHMDQHDLWLKTDFPSACFKIIMYSVQAQYGHVVVQMIMGHLDYHSKDSAELKAKITDVLSETVIIAAGGSIGPSVLDVFNSLLRHLRASVENNRSSHSQSDKDDNNRFQESIINTIGEFANHLPDFQKIEILMFVVNKMPLPVEDGHDNVTNTLLQAMLLKTILKVATTYRTVLMANAFPSSLKNPLLQMSVVDKPNTRLIVQRILHTLIDRHGNSDKFSKIWIPEDISELNLTLEKPSRQDIAFLKQGGSHILWHILENFRLNSNKKENIESLYTSMCLLLVELLTDDTYGDFADFILQLQGVARSEHLSPKAQCQVHAAAICFAYVYCEITQLPSLQAHVNQIIQMRRTDKPFLLPEEAVYGSREAETDFDVPKAYLLDEAVFHDSLESNGFSVSSLAKPLSIPDNVENALAGKDDNVSFSNLELDSSPPTRRSSMAFKKTEGLTLDQIKTVLDLEEEPTIGQSMHQQQIFEEFQSAPLETIMNRANSRNELSEKLFEILGDVTNGDIDSSIKAIAIDNIKYPKMFIY